MKAKPYEIDLWICECCASPRLIEDGGFFPEGNTIKDGDHPGGCRIECGYCGNPELIKIPFEPTPAGFLIWERRKDLSEEDE